jgi:uncharacterized membrane protein
MRGRFLSQLNPVLILITVLQFILGTHYDALHHVFLAILVLLYFHVAKSSLEATSSSTKFLTFLGPQALFQCSQGPIPG